MRGYRQPLSVPKGPDIGIAAIPLLTICRGVAGARVNDRNISENAHTDAKLLLGSEYIGRQKGRWIAVPTGVQTTGQTPCARIDHFKQFAGLT
jgi:hypothetical protein